MGRAIGDDTGRWRCFHSDITSHARRNPEPALSCSEVIPWHLRQNQLTQAYFYHRSIHIHIHLFQSVDTSIPLRLGINRKDRDQRCAVKQLANNGINNRRSRAEHRPQDTTTLKEREAKSPTQPSSPKLALNSTRALQPDKRFPSLHSASNGTPDVPP
jgi:hypothetical protein